jgi:hypothetical protein
MSKSGADLLKEETLLPETTFSVSRSPRPFSGVVPLFFILGGLGLALTLVPADPQPVGALRWSAVALTVGLLAGAVLDVLRNGLHYALRTEHLLMVGLVYWLLLDLIQGLYPLQVSSGAINGALFAVGLFVVGCMVGASQQPPKLPRGVRWLATYEPHPSFMFSLLLLSFALGIFYFALYSGFSPAVMLDGLTRARWSAPWSRGALGGWNALSEHMTYFGYLVPTLTVILALTLRRWLDSRVIIGLVLSAIMIAFLGQGGNRRVLGVVLGATLLTWVCHQRYQLRLKHALGALAVAVSLLTFFNFLEASRMPGLSNVVLTWEAFRRIRVDDNFLRLAQLIEIIPKEHPYGGFELLAYTLVRPIPRVLWPGKPTGINFSLNEYIGLGDTALTFSVVGESYYSFGWFGVFVGGFLFGLLARTWSRLLDEPPHPARAGVYALGAMAIIAGLRSLIELLLMSYPLLHWMILTALVRWLTGEVSVKTTA